VKKESLKPNAVGDLVRLVSNKFGPKVVAWEFQVKPDVHEPVTVQERERYEEHNHGGEAVGSKELAPL
jgi:hypothetical protein